MGVGADLVNDISNRVLDKNVKVAFLSNLLNAQGITEDCRWRFVLRLNTYRQGEQNASIDSFINLIKTSSDFSSDREIFLTIATFSIAVHVLGYEGACLRKASFKNLSWLDALNDFIVHQKMASASRQSVNFRVATFNYDRLLEESISKAW
jgi:hypothetical protein